MFKGGQVKKALLSLITLVIMGCDGGVPKSGIPFRVTAPNSSQGASESTLTFKYSSPPIPLVSSEIRFAEDISVNESSLLNTVDAFIVPEGAARPVVIYFHGGDLKSGDKKDAYESSDFFSVITGMDISVVNVNYRLIDREMGVGIRQLLADCQRALQFVRFYAKSFNIDPSKIILAGDNMGATIALWLALSNNLADVSSSDPIRRVSTSVLGAIAYEPASGFDPIGWENVLNDFNFEVESIEDDVKDMFGVNSLLDLQTTNMRNFRQSLDITMLIDRRDPEIWVSSRNYDNVRPVGREALISHPLHAWALRNQAQRVSLAGVFDVPRISNAPNPSETSYGFITRLIRD